VDLLVMWRLCSSVLLFLVEGVDGAGTNPFAQHPFYLNPVNQHEYDKSIENANGDLIRQNLLTMRDIASAYWIDRKNKIKGNGTQSVQGILADAASKSPPELVVLIWYDFPNRDCAAAASAGEICCAYNTDGTCDWGNGGDCSTGIKEYETQYVNPFIEVLVEYKGKVPVVIVFEPDSLPNFATNMDKPHCGSEETQMAYTKGATYALNALTTKTDATVYVDAAHGGWLGWDNNMKKFMSDLKSLDVDWTKIRGFSTNVAGYQPLGEMCPWQSAPGHPYRNDYCLNGHHKNSTCCSDPCNLLSQWDPADNELNYAQELHRAAKVELGMDALVIIDTGRNGVPGPRDDCSNWCNIRGAGAGLASTGNSPYPDVVDAFFYLKTPGESDGCTQVLPDGEACPRFDVMCGSSDSIGSQEGEPRAPEAGGWFDYQVQQLAEVANFASPFVPAPPSPPASTPQPRPAPPSAPPSAQSPQPSSPEPPSPSTGAGSCCWSGCGSAGCDSTGWCSESQGHCEGGCSGQWCPLSLAAKVGKVRPHRALRGENVFFQLAQSFKSRRGGHAALGKENEGGNDEL